MRHRTHDAGMDGGRDEHAAFFHAADRTGAVGPDVDLNEVRLDLLQVDLHACGRKTLAEPTGTGMVVADPVDVVIERVDRGRRDDASLAHRAAEEVLSP